MERRNAIAAATLGLLGGCSHALGLRPTYGIIVDYAILPGASTKEGVAAVSETGRYLFSPALLRKRLATELDAGGGRSYYSGGTLPQWVRVTWREGDWVMNHGQRGWTGGTIVGDYRVEVASRIPHSVLEYAAALRGRAVRLVFWLKDDGVLLAWDVKEWPDGTPHLYSMHGGDFVQPTLYNGKIVEPGWYLTPDGRKVMIDR
jgi:hypothetical protein